MPTDRTRDVQSVARAIDILTAFTGLYPRLQLREIADVVGLPRSTTRRLAATLVNSGFLRQESDGAYALGGRLLELGALVARSGAVATLALPLMKSVREITGQTVLVCEMDWVDRTWLITHRLDGLELLDISPPIGTRRPIGGGIMERAALSLVSPAEADGVLRGAGLVRRTDRSLTDPVAIRRQLEIDRGRGYATDDEEFVTGYRGVATGLGAPGEPVGAICVVARAEDADLRQLDVWGRFLVNVVSRPPAVDHA